MKHHNSQKRIYIKNAIYFITTNVDEPLFLFKENLFCDLFVADLKFCREIKQFNIFGYKVNPDHIHLLIQPTGKYNYSEIMQNLKRVSSLHINQIIEGEDIYPRLQWTPFLKKLREKLINTHNKLYNFPHFHWQSSFHDHIIRDKSDYYMRLNYIKKQWIQHELPENKYCFISKQKPDLSYTSQLKIID